ncbi:hypothetical protein HK096_000505, partial [Nowakowskiella sp. JEL0078]
MKWFCNNLFKFKDLLTEIFKGECATGKFAKSSDVVNEIEGNAKGKLPLVANSPELLTLFDDKDDDKEFVEDNSLESIKSITNSTNSKKIQPSASTAISKTSTLKAKVPSK